MNENALVYEYAVVRYVPRVEREEFINVGLLMVCKRRRWLRSGIALDAERIAAFDKAADIEALRHQLSMFESSARVLADCTPEERFRWFSAVKSAVIQTSRPHPGLIDCDEDSDCDSLLESTFSRLMQELVL